MAAPLRHALIELLKAHDNDVDAEIDCDVVASTPALLDRLVEFAEGPAAGSDPVEWSKRRETWALIGAEVRRLARGS